MKETTSELNTTVIVVISVGVLMAFFFGYIWPNIKGNFDSKATCSKATCNCEEDVRRANEGYCLCSSSGKVCTDQGEDCFTCVYKG